MLKNFTFQKIGRDMPEVPTSIHSEEMIRTTFDLLSGGQTQIRDIKKLDRFADRLSDEFLPDISWLKGFIKVEDIMAEVSRLQKKKSDLVDSNEVDYKATIACMIWFYNYTNFVLENIEAMSDADNTDPTVIKFVEIIVRLYYYAAEIKNSEDLSIEILETAMHCYKDVNPNFLYAIVIGVLDFVKDQSSDANDGDGFTYSY